MKPEKHLNKGRDSQTGGFFQSGVLIKLKIIYFSGDIVKKFLA